MIQKQRAKLVNINLEAKADEPYVLRRYCVFMTTDVDASSQMMAVYKRRPPKTLGCTADVQSV